MPDMAKLLANHGCPGPEIVLGRSSIADLYKPGARCGIYVLMFSDGQAYVGQSVDVVRRYNQHRRVHQDIQAMSFKEVLMDYLDRTEHQLIAACERSGHTLRNIVFSALPPIESDFDLIMSQEEQERWLSDLDFVDSTGSRLVNEDLRVKHARKFRRFRANFDTDGILQQVRCYFRAGVPAIHKGEVSFWSLSCLPPYGNPHVTLFMRLNINWQEVFTVYRQNTTGVDFFSLHLAAEPIKRDTEIGTAVPDIEITGHRYVPGGHDQVNIVAPDRSFQALIARRSVRKAIRIFNHRLMKKGACNFGRSHCLDLADTVMSN